MAKKPIRRTLWATTKYKEYEVPIYKVSGLWESRAEAWTGTSPLRGPMVTAEVCIQSWVFRKPKLLDEVLIHEFIHVIERAVGRKNLSHRLNGDNCTKSAQVLGEGLSQMLRELRQANLLDKPQIKRKTKQTPKPQ